MMPNRSGMGQTDPTELRHRIMSRNHGRTGPERALAAALWRKGLRYYTTGGYSKVTGTKLPGSPDLIFPGKRLVLFMDGCFWHGCPQCKGIPRQSGKFWGHKILENQLRDARVDSELNKMGWKVLRVWEHDVKSDSLLDQTVTHIRSKMAW